MLGLSIEEAADRRDAVRDQFELVGGVYHREPRQGVPADLGRRTIPSNLQLPPPQFRGPAGIDYICSNWIGLDGQRFYLNSSSPQIGTLSQLQANGTTVAQAWTQWWARGIANTVPVPLGLGVAPGNQVLSVLTAIDSRTVILVMVNLSTMTAMPAMATAPPVQLPDGTTATPEIAGATAEWIVERPAIPGQPTRYNFPDYGHTEIRPPACR